MTFGASWNPFIRSLLGSPNYIAHSFTTNSLSVQLPPFFPRHHGLNRAKNVLVVCMFALFFSIPALNKAMDSFAIGDRNRCSALQSRLFGASFDMPNGALPKPTRQPTAAGRQTEGGPTLVAAPEALRGEVSSHVCFRKHAPLFFFLLGFRHVTCDTL